VKTIGFIDYFIDEWHANNYPRWIRESALAGEFEVALAWEEMTPEGKRPLAEWCREYEVRPAASLAQVVEECDCLVVLSPDNPERHEELCDLPLRSGKLVYVDKTFAPDLATAKRLFAKAEQHGTPMYSCSALRYVESLERAMQELAGQRVEFVATRGPGSWSNYSVHQLEPLVMLLGLGACRVMSVGNGQVRALVVDYPDGRRGSLLQTAEHPFGFSVQSGSRTLTLEDMGDFFPRFVTAMLAFFQTGEVPVPREQTREIMALREAGAVALGAPDTWVGVPK
jgi:predicted dehydrogenase